MQLRAGERLFLYTDGVTEVYDEGSRSYGAERLRRTIATRQGYSLDEALGEITESVERFCGGVAMRDDISILGIEATNSPS